MGRFSPTVVPRHYDDPGFGGRLEQSLADINDLLDRREAAKQRKAAEAEDREYRDLGLAKEGIYRGQAPGPDVDVRAPVMEDVPLPPAFNPDEDHPLARGRRGMDTLRDSLGGGADELAAMFGDAAGAGRPSTPPPPRVPPPGAYNPIRGTFEPSIPLPTGGLQVDVTGSGNQRQLTENFYIDDDRTPEGRKRAQASEDDRRREQDLIDFWLDRGETPESARLMATMEMLDPGINPGDVLDERTDTGEREGNRANWTAYNERLRALGEPEVPFDPRTNWSQQAVYLGNDIRGEQQIRTRPRTTAGDDGKLSPSEARSELDYQFGYIPEGGGARVSALEALKSEKYNRYRSALTSGTMTIEDVVEIEEGPKRKQAAAVEGARGYIQGGLRPGTFTPQGPGGAPATDNHAHQLIERYGSAEAALQAIEAAGGADSPRAEQTLQALRRIAGE